MNYTALNLHSGDAEKIPPPGGKKNLHYARGEKKIAAEWL